MRRLLLLLDGDVQQVYDEAGEPFRSRYFPFVKALAEGGPIGISELAALTRVSQPAATQTIREMEKAGLVRIRVGVDRRARAVELSASGRALVRRLLPVWQAIEAAAAALDRELPASLRGVAEAACAALERRPFRARIQEQR